MTDDEILAMKMPGERGYVVPALQDPLLKERSEATEEDLIASMIAEPSYRIGEPDIEDGFVDRVVRGAERVGSGAKGVYQGLDALATDILQFPAKYVQDPLGEGAKIEQEAVELAKGVLAGDPEAQEKALIATSMSMVEPAATAADVELARRDVRKAMETRDPGDIATAGVSTVFAAIPIVGVGLTKSVTKAAPDPEVLEGLSDLKGKPPELNEDGTITLYHRTTPEAAAEIRKTGTFSSKENTDEVFLSSKPTGQAEGYGSEVVEVRVDPAKVRLDDAFDDEIHVAVKTADVAKPSTAAPQPVFESVLEKAAVDKIQKKTGVDAIIPTLRSGGATKSEIADTKIPEFVEQAKAAGKKSVTKDEVIKHLDENKVQIEEVRLGKSLQKIPEEIKDLGDQRYVAFESLNEEASSLARVLAPDNTASSQVDKFLDNPFHFDKLYINYVGGINRIRRFDDVPDDMQDAVTSVVSLDTYKEIRLWEPEDAARITKARNVINAKLADPEYQKLLDEARSKVAQAVIGSPMAITGSIALNQHDNLITIARILNEMPEAETRLAALRQFQASPKYQEYSRLSKDFKEKYIAFQNDTRKFTPVYERYSVPHGDNYQEILLTVPQKKFTDLPKGFEVLDMADVYKNEDLRGSYQVFHNGAPVGGSRGIFRTPEEAKEYAIDEINEADGWADLPGRQKFTDSHHDDIPNVMAHIRTKDRYDHKGRKILFVEEIQSDWHQAGRKKGYDDDKFHIIDIDGNVVKKVDTESAAKQYIREAQDNSKRTGKPPEDLDYKPPGTRPYLVPDAPLKDTKEWTALAVRRVFREAADKGYDGVAFSRADMITPVVTLPGEQAFEALGDRDSFISILAEMRQRGGQYAEAADEAEGVFKGNEYFYDTLIPSIAQKQSFVPPKRLPKETSEDYKVRLDEAKKAHRSNTLIELKDVGFSKVKERHTPGMSYPQFNKQVERLADSGWVQEVPFFELTPKVKEKVSKPQKLYSLALPGIAVGAAAAEEEELSAAAALGALGMGGMALYKGARGARAAGRAADAPKPPAATDVATAVKTDTPEFKRWSGGAPVIKRGDAALQYGNDIPEGPVVFEVYHGTNRDFDTFEYSKIGTSTDTGYFGEGFYATTDPEWASKYARSYQPGGSVMPLYMKLENPLHLKKSDAREVYDPGMEEYVTMDREYHIRDVLGLPEDASSQEVADVLRAKGYDGVTYRGHTDVGIGSRDIEVMVLDQYNIKSKFNPGTFDPTDPSILKGIGVGAAGGAAARAMREDEVQDDQEG